MALFLIFRWSNKLLCLHTHLWLSCELFLQFLRLRLILCKLNVNDCVCVCVCICVCVCLYTYVEVCLWSCSCFFYIGSSVVLFYFVWLFLCPQSFGEITFSGSMLCVQVYCNRKVCILFPVAAGLWYEDPAFSFTTKTFHMCSSYLSDVVEF